MNTIGKGWESDAPEDENARASRKYPSIAVDDAAPDGAWLHVFAEDESEDDWSVWLNAGDTDFSGMCIGTGATRDEAVADAVNGLEEAVARLQGPAW
jgi:hypothetical protein